MPDPVGYGRILREGDKVTARGHRDASQEQRRIAEVYTGFMAVPTSSLKRWLSRLTNDNAQGEYYLTGIVGFAVQDGADVVAVTTDDKVQVDGVNSASELAALERAFQLRRAQALMEQGVRIADPARFDVRGQLECAQDVEIDVNCLFEGRVSLGEGVRIGANCVIANATISAGAVINPFTHMDGGKLGVRIGEGAMVGPFARLRPGADLGPEVHVGNFVEVKNSPWLVGPRQTTWRTWATPQWASASITERARSRPYDGANKHRTVIEADVHIGSNSVLVAPVTIGRDGTVGREFHHHQGHATRSAGGGARQAGEASRTGSGPKRRQVAELWTRAPSISLDART